MQVVCMYHKKTFDGKGEAFHPDELHEYERERERERDCDIHNQRKVVNLKSPLEKKTDMNHNNSLNAKRGSRYEIHKYERNRENKEKRERTRP